MRVKEPRTRLESRIIAKYGTLAKCAEDTGITKSSLSRHLMNGTFSSKEMKVLVGALKIPAKDIPLYFFTEKLPKM